MAILWEQDFFVLFHNKMYISKENVYVFIYKFIW